jgi:hypothetical protein
MLLKRISKILAYDDSEVSSNPLRRSVDWTRDIQGIPVEDAQSVPLSKIPGLSEVTLFDGSRTIYPNSSTQYSLGTIGGSSSRYRLEWTGTGQAPVFRTDRLLSLSGGTVTFDVQSNSTVEVTHSAGAVFGNVEVGDVFFVPGTSTGDSGPFNPLNEGEWVVLSVVATQLVIARAPDTVFSGYSETVTIASNSEAVAYSSAGVQVGDTAELKAGFATSARGSYVIRSVTATWIEFTSTSPLAAVTIIPGATALAIYSAAKRYVYLETDQLIVLKFNGSTEETCKVAPFLASDPDKVGVFEKCGPAFSLVVKNLSTSPARIFYVTAE